MDYLSPVTDSSNVMLSASVPDENVTTMSNMANSTGEQSELFHVPTGLIVLLSLLYGSISFVAVIGNALVILVVSKNRSLRTVTNFFIANLSVADVIIGIFGIPFQFQAALLQRWDLPHFLCPVAPFVKELTVNVSIVTLTVISIDRYFAVIHPLRPRCTRRAATIVMVIVWTFSLASALPAAVVFRVEPRVHNGRNISYCTAKWDQFAMNDSVSLAKVYQLYLVIVQYFFPLMVISYAYIRIMRRVWITNAPGTALDARDQIMSRNKTKVIKMLVIVVALFAFCWLPLQTYNLLSNVTEDINLYKYINIIWLSCNLLAMSNSCYNPFIYALLNEKFKHGFKSLMPCTRCERKLSAFSSNYKSSRDTKHTTIVDTTAPPRGHSLIRSVNSLRVTLDCNHAIGEGV